MPSGRLFVMPEFAYTARTKDGQQVQGTLTAENEQAAIRHLDERTLFPVRLSRQEALPAVLGGRRRVRLRHLAGFYAQLADLLRAGVPILRALDLLARQNPKAALSSVLKELREDVAGGATLADAMEKHPLVFPELNSGMVRAGEQGGFLEQVLERLARFVEQRDELRNRVISSMVYPMFLLVIGVTVVIVMVTYFMPKLEPLLAGMQLSSLTRGVIVFGNFIRDYYWVVIFTVVLLGATAFPYLRTEQGKHRWHKLQLRLPVVGPIFALVAVCRFCRILGTLLANGVTMLQALHISRESAGNVVLSDTIEEAAENVRAGKALAETLSASGIFPIDIADMIAVGEESNRLDQVLVEIADTQEARTSRKIEVAVRMLEPFMLLAVFAMVFVIALALLLPILKMSMGSMAQM